MNEGITTSSLSKQPYPNIPARCVHCGSANVCTKNRGPHRGAFCSGCDRWVTWVPSGRPVTVMPFGKHKGEAIVDLPQSYLNWILENVELRGSLLRALEAEYERRGEAAA